MASAANLPVVPLYIDGEEVAPDPSLQFPVYSYQQQKDVWLAQSADAKTAKLAVEAASRAFQTWKDVTAVERRNLLLRYCALLRANEKELMEIQHQETSASEMWCRKNISLATDLIEETAACVTSLKGEILQPDTKNTMALAFTVPVGPVLVIAPWNSPIILGARNIATAVAAGCTVVFKASELCPKLHLLCAKLLVEAGLPRGVVNVIQASRQKAPEVTEAVIAHPAIRKVEFVGSAAVGKVVGQICAKHLKPIFMELGGKGPSIILEDADLESAAQKCVLGAFLHHGQLCFSTERIIVLETVSKEFQMFLKNKAESFVPDSGVSKRIVEASYAKLLDAEKKGAKFLTGGPKFATSSSLKPTIVLGLTSEMDLYHEEAFGPSVALFVARDEAHAVEIANDTTYGLSAAVHTRSLHRGLEIAKKLESGQVHLNRMTPHDEPTLPLGGAKGSGWGRNNAIWGLREFSEIKTVTWTQGVDAFV